MDKFAAAKSAYYISIGTCLGLMILFCGFLCCVPKVCMFLSVLISCAAAAILPVGLSFVDQDMINDLVSGLDDGSEGTITIDAQGLYSFIKFTRIALFGFLGFWVLVCFICSVKLEIAASIMQTTAKVILRNVWVFLVPLVGYALLGAYLVL